MKHREVEQMEHDRTITQNKHSNTTNITSDKT